MTASLWPWLTIAGAGALHGLNPASGWACAAAWRLRSRDRPLTLRTLLPVAAGPLALALWTFVTATMHGAGWMLAPALIPLCAAGAPAGWNAASGSLMLALAAVAVHGAAMLGMTLLVSRVLGRGLDAVRRWLSEDSRIGRRRRTTRARLRFMLAWALLRSDRCNHASQPGISTRSCSFFSMPMSMAAWIARVFSGRRKASPRPE